MNEIRIQVGLEQRGGTSRGRAQAFPQLRSICPGLETPGSPACTRRQTAGRSCPRLLLQGDHGSGFAADPITSCPRPAVTDPRHQTQVCVMETGRQGRGPCPHPSSWGRNPSWRGRVGGFLPAGAPRHARWDPPKEWLSSRPLPPRLYLPVFWGIKHGLALWVDLCPPDGAEALIWKYPECD